MRTKQLVVKTLDGMAEALEPLAAIQPNFVLVFGARSMFSDARLMPMFETGFPEAIYLGCSTAGEISNSAVEEESCVITAVRLDKGILKSFSTQLGDMDDSRAAGARIGAALTSPNLRAVLVFGPGIRINGSALVDGLASEIGAAVPIMGGLAGDGTAFEKTYTLGNDGISADSIVAVGFFGDAIEVAHGSLGGWDSFGPPRKVTRCDGNVLYELDGEPALEVYKRYLGKYASGLPASGLLFPFSMQEKASDAEGLIRTILGIDETSGSLILAGAIQPDGYLKLMHATTDKLVNAAEDAAENAVSMGAIEGDNLAVLVSCVGRKLVMGDRVDEEVEAVRHVFGDQSTLTGFYSYGEISPLNPGGTCHLHNQTMTITRIGER